MGGKTPGLPLRAVDTAIVGCPLRNPRMKKASPRVLAPWSLLSNRYLHFAVLVALPFAIYSNNYRHAYVLDDGYTLLSLSLIHISEPTRLGMISYAVFCLKKK